MKQPPPHLHKACGLLNCGLLEFDLSRLNRLRATSEERKGAATLSFLKGEPFHLRYTLRSMGRYVYIVTYLVYMFTHTAKCPPYLRRTAPAFVPHIVKEGRLTCLSTSTEEDAPS